jgi:hypothetical protein
MYIRRCKDSDAVERCQRNRRHQLLLLVKVRHVAGRGWLGAVDGE